MLCWALCVAVYKKAKVPNLQRTQIEPVIKIPRIFENPQDPKVLKKQNIIDTLYAPLSAAEVTLAIILASVTRSIFILIISVLVFSLIEVLIYVKNK